MADEKVTLSGINWRETFAFTHLFRSFRVAIHPSKLILGLLLLLSLYAGGRILDAVWPNNHRAVTGEVTHYARIVGQPGSGDQLIVFQTEGRRSAQNRYEQLLYTYNVYERGNAEAPKAAERGDKYDDLEDKIEQRLDEKVKAAKESRKTAMDAANKIEDDKAEDAAKKLANDEYNLTVASVYASARRDLDAAKAVHGQGIFINFFEYEVRQVDAVVGNVLNWNWGLNNGILGNVYDFVVTGPAWLVTAHPVYFICLLVIFLLAWSIFGGAIARIAAIQVAREEKISVRAALKFSISKLLSFIFAPLIPVLIIVGIGLLVLVGALIGNIPFIGPIVVGLLFFLALAAGFVMTLVLLGLIGGFNLMYPTIAVEGSDSFDAISRSFSYLYARPWKMAFYTAISVVYGALTYLFVRFFIFLTLMLVHHFADGGMFTHAYSGAETWAEMWPAFTIDKLTYDIDFLALGAGASIGAFLVAMWNYLLIGMLGAFAISFYFSANTIIYYLMRKEVDATEMDDVYVEQLDEEFTETPPAVTEPAPTASAPAPVAPPIVEQQQPVQPAVETPESESPSTEQPKPEGEDKPNDPPRD